MDKGMAEAVVRNGWKLLDQNGWINGRRAVIKDGSKSLAGILQGSGRGQ